MLKPVDYNRQQHAGYRAGRSMPAASQAVWAEALARRAPTTRPLRVLDLGGGIGRLTTRLAETFGGPVWGVEPFDRMREQAVAAPHPEAVTYLAGRAEAIPLPDASCDVVLMFLSLHHVRDRDAAAREIARVLVPGGRVLIRSTFSDRIPHIDWHGWFDGAREAERLMFPTTTEVEAMFAPFGFQRLALDVVRERYADSMVEYAGRLRLRSISTFEHLSEAAIEEGFHRLDAAVALTPEAPVDGDGDLMTLG